MFIVLNKAACVCVWAHFLPLFGPIFSIVGDTRNVNDYYSALTYNSVFYNAQLYVNHLESQRVNGRCYILY